MKIDLMTAFFHQLKNIALKNKNVFFITADHGAWALEDFKNPYSTSAAAVRSSSNATSAANMDQYVGHTNISASGNDVSIGTCHETPCKTAGNFTVTKVQVE